MTWEAKDHRELVRLLKKAGLYQEFRHRVDPLKPERKQRFSFDDTLLETIEIFVQTQGQARHTMIRNIMKALKDRGLYIGATPDSAARRIITKMKNRGIVNMATPRGMKLVHECLEIKEKVDKGLCDSQEADKAITRLIYDAFGSGKSITLQEYEERAKCHG
jgi:hypothetical protein